MTAERLEDRLVKSAEHPSIHQAVTITDRSQNEIAMRANRQDFRPFIDSSNPFVLDMGDGTIVQAKGPLATAKTDELAQAKVAPRQMDPADLTAAGRDLKPAAMVPVKDKNGHVHYETVEVDDHWNPKKDKQGHYIPITPDAHQKAPEKHHTSTEKIAQANLSDSRDLPNLRDKGDAAKAKDVEEPGETSAEAAKHGKLVWKKNADGKYVPEQPPGWPACPDPSKNPNEFWAWVRYGHATGAPDDKPQDGDTVDGHKFHKFGHNF